MTIFIIDTCAIINHHLNNITKGYTTKLVIEEIKSMDALLYYKSIESKIEIVPVEEKYILEVMKVVDEHNILVGDTDISVIALTLQKSIEADKLKDCWISKYNMDKVNKFNNVKCLSTDYGVVSALKALSLVNGNLDKEYKMRCYTCYKIYDKKIDFCSKCGYNTITRVSVRQDKNGIVPNLKYNYRYNRKEMKDKHGNIIKSTDQKEYKNIIQEREREMKKLMNKNK
ncbi:NOB1-domain containing protein [Spraguea lophii 42_110]|uniref:NOB1-domain containing protein n=1 Tax=Spraguea lophii (strain 42_110) TaxID=1358809 RepID=S7XJ55_SPRLO|nr:NOB1-domain containing protein [Spraguea lophii 42_110]